MFSINIIAYMSIAGKVIPHMAKGGAIINICSIQAFHPMNGILDYATTKVCYCVVAALPSMACHVDDAGIGVPPANHHVHMHLHL